MADEGGSTSIAARIAALKLDQVGRQPGEPRPIIQRNNVTEAKKPPPALPRRPGLPSQQQSINAPSASSHAISTTRDIGNLPAGRETNGHAPQMNGKCSPTPPTRPPVRNAPPPLPSRKSSGPTPPLPPRRPSEMSLEPPPRPDYSTSRRLSSDSTASAVSAKSSLSRVSTRTGTSVTTNSSTPLYTIKAPAYDATKLPPLPPKRETSETEKPSAILRARTSSPNVLPQATRPPLLPTRTNSSQEGAIAPAPISKPKRSALDFGFNNTAATPPPPPPLVPIGRPSSTPATDGVPPPIPLASRPDLTQLQASKPKPNAIPSGADCLKCRDFSSVDAHAARFPRQSIPSTDLGWLAQQLTAPFPSLTDKARAIFTWLHHNIDYDTEAFYNGTVKPSTPASTLATGLAVCEGYSGLFAGLAVKCGLESVVVVGHGKGYGYSQPSPNTPLPPFNAGHAWNAVKIDNGQWKLIDCCWGAGAVEGPGRPYKRGFSPHHFTRDNNDFGLSHYPKDQRHFYRTDGRASITWEEYLLGPSNGAEPPQMFNGYTTEEGIAVESFQPLSKRLSVRDPQPYTRFQFNKVCSHWDNERHGKGKHYVYMLEIGGVDGRSPRKVPFETNGMFWWVDVAPRELGAPGQQVKIAAVNKFAGGDGRGVSPAEFKDKVGRTAMGWGYVALYELV